MWTGKVHRGLACPLEKGLPYPPPLSPLPLLMSTLGVLRDILHPRLGQVSLESSYVSLTTYCSSVLCGHLPPSRRLSWSCWLYSGHKHQNCHSSRSGAPPRACPCQPLSKSLCALSASASGGCFLPLLYHVYKNYEVQTFNYS